MTMTRIKNQTTKMRLKIFGESKLFMKIVHKEAGRHLCLPETMCLVRLPHSHKHANDEDGKTTRNAPNEASQGSGIPTINIDTSWIQRNVSESMDSDVDPPIDSRRPKVDRTMHGILVMSFTVLTSWQMHQYRLRPIRLPQPRQMTYSPSACKLPNTTLRFRGQSRTYQRPSEVVRHWRQLIILLIR